MDNGFRFHHPERKPGNPYNVRRGVLSLSQNLPDCKGSLSSSVKETRGQPINGALKQAIPGQPPERTYILFWELKYGEEN